MTTILLVGNDRDLRDLLRYALAREGFATVDARDSREAAHLARTAHADLAILDAEPGDRAGVAGLIALRASARVPVIVLADHATDEDVVAGLEHGADDYVAKPFSMQVLLERVRAILRRAARRGQAGTRAARELRVGDLLLSADRRELQRGEDRVPLTPMQGAILDVLFQHAGHTVSPERILERGRAHGLRAMADPSVVKTHIRYLRAKLDVLPGGDQLIRTVPGGYIILPPDESEGDVRAPDPGARREAC